MKGGSLFICPMGLCSVVGGLQAAYESLRVVDADGEMTRQSEIDIHDDDLIAVTFARLAFVSHGRDGAPRPPAEAKGNLFSAAEAFSRLAAKLRNMAAELETPAE